MTFSRSGGKKLAIGENNFEDLYDYFWFEALEDNCSVYLTDYKANTRRDFLPIYYSFDKKEWHLWEYTVDASNSNKCTFETINLSSTGDKVWFYGECTGIFTNNTMAKYATSSVNFHGTGRLACGGIVTSLIRKDLGSYTPSAANQRYGTMGSLFNGMTTLEDASEVILADPVANSQYFDVNGGLYSYMFYDCSALKDNGIPVLPSNLTRNCFGYMFRGCNSLTRTPELPATILAQECYQYMFASCANLIEVTSLPATTLAENCYAKMFRECSNLVSVCILPATTMATSCYDSMFYGCTSLVNAPELPATTLAQGCYGYMFQNCSSLVNGPSIIPAEVSALGCCGYMFAGCISLKRAPILSATTLAQQCYQYMFSNCSALETAPELPATVLGNKCYQYMFNACSSLKKAPALPATILADHCYYYMFKSCTSLSGKVTLPAETLATHAYYAMFMDSGLTEIDIKATDINYTQSMWDMLRNCSALKMITVAFTDWSGNVTNRWVSGVPGDYITPEQPRQFNMPNELTEEFAVNRIPVGWVVAKPWEGTAEAGS